MRHLSAFLLMSCLPTLAVADYCTSPSEYTIDRRCYVTSGQKAQSPYSAVVSLVDEVNGGIYCSGTLVNSANKIYVYTAQHCIMNRNMNTISVKLQNGRVLSAVKNNEGNFVATSGMDPNGDWAIYEVLNAPSTIPNVNAISGNYTGTRSNDARIIGYGSLKIMSDADIEKFKDMYIGYLNKQRGVSYGRYGATYGMVNDGVLVQNKNVHDFLINTSTGFFNDTQLKVSFCTYGASAISNGCQIWTGNSGCGIFNSNNDLIGISTSGLITIGGPDHGRLLTSVNLATKHIAPQDASEPVQHSGAAATATPNLSRDQQRSLHVYSNTVDNPLTQNRTDDAPVKLYAGSDEPGRLNVIRDENKPKSPSVKLFNGPDAPSKLGVAHESSALNKLINSDTVPKILRNK